MFAVRPRKPPLEPVVGELESRRYTAPVTFSIGCLDIRHRLPDPKAREMPRLAACVHNAGVSTPQSGACPPRSKDTFNRLGFAMRWKKLPSQMLAVRHQDTYSSGNKPMRMLHGREDALAEATGMRALKATGDAVPVRLLTRDLLFLADWLTPMLGERRLSVLIRQHGIGKQTVDAVSVKLPARLYPRPRRANWAVSWLRRRFTCPCDQADTAKIFRDAAHSYKGEVTPYSPQPIWKARRRRRQSALRSPHPICSRNPARRRRIRRYWTIPARRQLGMVRG